MIYPSLIFVLSQELVGKYTHIENYFMREGLTKVAEYYIIMTS